MQCTPTVVQCVRSCESSASRHQSDSNLGRLCVHAMLMRKLCVSRNVRNFQSLTRPVYLDISWGDQLSCGFVERIYFSES